MCTAIFRHRSLLFGRTLDVDADYCEGFITVPRRKNEYGYFGIGILGERTALLFDGMNEVGLRIAALSFPRKDLYAARSNNGRSIPSGEVISTLLKRAKSTAEAVDILNGSLITDESSEGIEATLLHWMITDGKETVVCEPKRGKMHIYQNPYGVMTNAPDLPSQLDNLSRYRGISSSEPARKSHIPYPEPISFGYGLIGMPGDYSSESRFVRAYILSQVCEDGGVEDFFRLTDSVSIARGAVIDGDRRAYTRYTSCMDACSMTYYYTTYQSRTVRAVSVTEKDMSLGSPTFRAL